MAPNESSRLCIDTSSLPDISKPEMDFLDSSFFQSDKSPRPQLPTPASIIEAYGDGGARVVKIENLNIAVKINHTSHLRLEEAQTMRVIRQIFPNGEVPVPEVFGLRRHRNQNFVYMSLVHGKTLREAWPSLTKGDKELIGSELRQIIASLRLITQDCPNQIASVNNGVVQDRFFILDYEEGPFLNIKPFNDWLFAAATRQRPGPDGIAGLDLPEMYRDLIPDTGNVYFTHGDLTLGNIIISSDSSPKICGVIDWEQAGWYPEYWEYCKMMYGVELYHDWREEDWPDKITKPFEDAFFAFSEYSLWRCP
ncbi:kinase-like domain-containing protein [Mariannaea sp. PMI_226]|nr:kinase-like domain-containing protein [Mariannaea sp. PMI_226]